jgi:FkbM family methyltransferase
MRAWWTLARLANLTLVGMRARSMRAAASARSAIRRPALAFARARGWFTLYIPGSEAPLFARPGTSDLKAFQAIFSRRQHDIAALPAAQVIFDLGANVGYSTIDFAVRFPEARIIAVEAEAENARLLRLNTASFPQIEVVHAAVWSRGGTVAIEDVGNDRWGFQVRDEGTQPRRVRAITIPELMRETGVGRIDLLKVDIEGAEHELLRKRPDWLLDVGAIVIEFHESSPGATAASERVLARHGFAQQATLEENRYYEGWRTVGARRVASRWRQPRPRLTRRKALAAIATSLLVFGAFPEALGDWPYNPFGKDSRAQEAGRSR